MNNLLKYGIGLAALGLTVYVAGVAWRRSQKNNKNGAAAFAGAAGGSRLRKIQGGMGGNIPKFPKSNFSDAAGGSRLSAIAKAGGFRNTDGFADAQGGNDNLSRFRSYNRRR